jgi:predicted DNA-binding transcriptional regulator AlpA
MNEHNRGAASRVVSKPAEPYLTPNGHQGVPLLRQYFLHGLPRSVTVEKVKRPITQFQSSVATPVNKLAESLQSSASVTSMQRASSLGEAGGVGDGPRAEPARLVAPPLSPLPSDATINATRQTPNSSNEDPRPSGPIAAIIMRATEGAPAPVGSSALLTEKDVAATLGLKPATLRNWRVKGEGPRFLRLSRRAIRYSRADVGEWVASVNERDRGQPWLTIPRFRCRSPTS